MSNKKRRKYKNQKVVDEYLKQFNPCESHPSIGVDLVAVTRLKKAIEMKSEPLNFDLRAYAAYVKENNLTASDITEEILNKFIINQK